MSDTFEECLKNCLKNNQYIISHLRDLISEIEDHHAKCNVARTVGTTVGVAGTATLVGSLFLAPFTGGASVAVGLTSLGCSLVGGGTQLLTNLVDNTKTKEIIENLQSIVRNKNRTDEKLKKQSENINKMVHKLVIEKGLDEGLATLGVLLGIARGKVDLKNEKSMSDFLRHHRVTIPASMATWHNNKIIFDTTRITSLSVGAGIGAHSFFCMGTTVGKSFLKNATRTLAVGAVIFSAVDIATLIHSWAQHHPSLENVQKLKSDMYTEMKDMEKFLEVLESLKDKVTYQSITIRGYPITIVGNELASELLWKILQEPDEVNEYFQYELKLNFDVEDYIYKKRKMMLTAAVKCDLDKIEVQKMVKDIINSRGAKARKHINLLMEELMEKLNKIKVGQKENDDKKRSKRGEHVINNGVLKFQADVLDSFCFEVFGRSFVETKTYAKKSVTYKHYNRPISTQNTENIRNNLIAHIPNDVIYIDVNKFVYGIFIHVLKDACVEHMKELYHNKMPGPTSGSQHSTHIRNIVPTHQIRARFRAFRAMLILLH